MRFYRIFVCLLVLSICLTLLCSCAKKDTLSINSPIFTELEAQEVDIDSIDIDWFDDIAAEYEGPQFKIVERDGKIFLEEIVPEGAYWYAETYTCCLYYRYLLAVNYYKGDYWLAVYDTGTSFIEGAKSERLLNMRCSGLLQSQMLIEHENGETLCTKDPNVAYAFVRENEYTKLPSYEDYHKGYIYRFENINEHEYKFEKFAELDSIGQAFMMDEDNIVVATSGALYCVDPEGNVTELFTSDYWKHLSFNSIVKIDNCYYLGAYEGILKYDLLTKEDTWYPYYNTEE